MNDFDAKILELSRNDEAEKIEQLLQDRLKKEPENIELWLRLAALEQSIPSVDVFKHIACLEKVLALDKDNAIAMLLMVYAKISYALDIDEAFKNKFLLLHTDNNELNSMLKYIASWFYFGKNDKTEEQLLKESIRLHQGHVWNYVYLAQLYFINERNENAEVLIQKALSNVTKVYSIQNHGWDKTNVNELLNQCIKGVYLTNINLSNIQNCVKKNATELDLKILNLSKRREREKIEQLLEKRLQKEPNNIDLLIRLTVLETKLPFADPDKCFECLKKVLELDKDNAIAALLLAYTYTYVDVSGVDESLKDTLISLHTNDAELNSMLKYVASWFYEDTTRGNNAKTEELLLKESINFYQGHVYNYKRLAQLYFTQGRKKEAKNLMQKAIKNVITIFPIENRIHDVTDASELLNEEIKGTHTANYNELWLELKKMDN